MQYRPRSQQDLTTDTFKPNDVIHRGILDERIKAVLDCGDNIVTTCGLWNWCPHLSSEAELSYFVGQSTMMHRSGLRELDDGEAPEEIGRGERHGGIIKNMMNVAMKDHHVTGKDLMNLCASIQQIIKKDSMRKEGFSLSLWYWPRLFDDQVHSVKRASRDNLDFDFATRRHDRIWFQGQVTDEYAKRLFFRMHCGRWQAASMLR